MKFLHVMIRVKDINKSLKFYQDLFDMNLVNEMELEDSKLYFLSDEDGQTQIELTYNFDTPKNGYINGDAFGHFAFNYKNGYGNFFNKNNYIIFVKMRVLCIEKKSTFGG